ncbi:hypothetical protein [Streptomyces griseoluteus]
MIGAGTLGHRIALMAAGPGGTVRVYENRYAAECLELPTGPRSC